MNKSIFFLIAYFYISSCTYINDNTSKFFNENENAKTSVAEIAKRTAESSNKSSAFNTEIESKTRLFINQGQKVEIIESVNDWYKVWLPNNQIGWLQVDDLALKVHELRRELQELRSELSALKGQ